MSVAPALMVADVSLITEQHTLALALMRHLPQGVFDWVNKVATQYKGRDLDQQALATAYDAATTRIIATLERVQDDDFVKSAVYPGWDPLLSGEVSLEKLFHYVKAHFETHEPQIRVVVAAQPPRT
jgi:hypothetical protein